LASIRFVIAFPLLKEASFEECALLLPDFSGRQADFACLKNRPRVLLKRFAGPKDPLNVARD
jgi:hypothetical protein